MATDLIAGASWYCSASLINETSDLSALSSPTLEWLPALVPGTAAGALRAIGRSTDGVDFDGSDWWFRCLFSGPVDQVPHLLRLSGLATIADVWLNQIHLLHSEDMFVAHEIEIEQLEPKNELVIRFAGLGPFLAQRRSRPRWRTYLTSHQNLRWLRTTLLGRLPGWAATPAPVGPWRPVSLEPVPTRRVVKRHIVARCVASAGEIELRIDLQGTAPPPKTATLRIADQTFALDVQRQSNRVTLEGSAHIDHVDRWWPHTHGTQTLYSIAIDLDSEILELGQVGFRTVEIDQHEGAFVVRVNDVEIFCRGAVWMPTDPIALASSSEETRATLQLAREANMNMIRLPATGIYEDQQFWDLCDELGIMVWQDCTFAFFDPPNEPEFTAQVAGELSQVFAELGGRPSLVVLCGGQEIESQAAMLGLPREKWPVPLLEETIPALVSENLPNVAYVTSNPSGGDLPFQMDSGVSHFFGIGGYLRPIDDARRARVRFAAECLAFAVPPETLVMEEEWGGSAPAGHDPQWKLGVHHDAGRSWDMEDMQSHYVRQLFGVDPFLSRWQDPERAQDLARAAVVHIMTNVMSEWRRGGSSCSGALVLALRDLRRGGGWGMIDSSGRPKAPWFALRRVFQPVALLMTDEGLNGLHLHLVNDTRQPFEGTIDLALYARGELLVEHGERNVAVDARGFLAIEASGLLNEWWDLTLSYGFGAPAFDTVVARLSNQNGEPVSEAFHLPTGLNRPVETDIGLAASASPRHDGCWELIVSTERFAQWVVIDIPGFRPEDSWFHLAPGISRTIVLQPLGEETEPNGRVRALNAQGSARFLQ